MTENKAQQTALQVAAKSGIDASEVRRVFDTAFPKHYPCWRISDGVVVYEDDPGCVVSIAARPGRLVEVAP